MEAEVQTVIGTSLDLSSHVVEKRWLDIDLTKVHTRYSRELPRLPSARQTLKKVFAQTAWLQHVPPRELYAVVIVPALFHVDQVFVLRREVAKMTGQPGSTLIVLRQSALGNVELCSIIPDVFSGAAFQEAVCLTQRLDENDNKG